MSERHLDPTPNRKQRAQREGRFPRSRDLSSVAVLLAAASLILAFGSSTIGDLREMMSAQLRMVSTNVSSFEENVEPMLLRVVTQRLLPFAGLLFLVAIGSQIVQGGWVWAPQRLVPDPSRMKPQPLASRLPVACSLLVKTTAVLLVTGGLVRLRLGAIATASPQPFFDPEQVAGSIVRAGVYLLTGLVVVAAADYVWSLYRYQQSLKMSEEEMREELRGLAGGVSVRAAMAANRERPQG